MLVIENNVSLIDLPILTISGDLGNSVANVFSNVTASAFYTDKLAYSFLVIIT